MLSHVKIYRMSPLVPPSDHTENQRYQLLVIQTPRDGATIDQYY